MLLVSRTRSEPIYTGQRVLLTTAGTGYIAKERFALPKSMPLSWDALDAVIQRFYATARPEDVIGRIRAMVKGTRFEVPAEAYIVGRAGRCAAPSSSGGCAQGEVRGGCERSGRGREGSGDHVKIGEKLRLNYDDNGVDIVDKINEALKEHGLEFEDDEEPHDGFNILTLKRKKGGGGEGGG